MDEDKYIDACQAAKRLGVSVPTVYRMFDDGRLGGIAHSGIGSSKRTIKISEESIKVLMEDSKVLSTFQENRKKTEQLRLFA